jgi:vitamin K-dependent gamma-carboxylase
VFFEPDWPRRALARVRRAPAEPRPLPLQPPASASASARPRWRVRGVAAAAAVWILIQLALPLRHLAYPGDHRWTAQGYRFGWNVLLVERVASVAFLVHDPATGRTWTYDPARLYTATQLRVMAGEPDLIQQAAHAIAADEARRGHRVEVRVDAWLSLNGRPAARWIDPGVDLAAEPRNPWSKDWILPAPGA